MLRIGTQTTDFSALSELQSTDRLECADTADVIGEQNQSEVISTLSQPRSNGMNEVFSQVLGLDIQGILKQQLGLIPFKPPLWSAAFGDANEVAMNDVRQGTIADCFVMSAIASVARTDPQAIKRMIQDNGDGTYTVTFKQKKVGFGVGPNEYEDKKVTVTGNFAPRAGNSGDYGEIWPQIIEKAYAQFKQEQTPQLGMFGPAPTDAYDPIANSGNPAEVIEAMTGRPAEQWDTGLMGFASPFDGGFDRVKKEFDAGKNLILGSKNFMTSGWAAISNPYGIVPAHAYTVQNIYTDNEGKKWVQLYNPWGTPSSQPRPIPFEELTNYFSNFTVC
jgi:hypothetical protein